MQPLRQLQRIQRIDRAEHLDCLRRFIRLQMPDQVNIRSLQRRSRNLRSLRLPLLHPVLPKPTHAQR